MEQTIVIVVAGWLGLNFLVAPLLGLLVVRRRRPRPQPPEQAWPDSRPGGSSGMGRHGLRTDGYASILLSRLAVQTCRVLAVERACLFVAASDDSREFIAVVAHGLDEDVIGERVAIDGPLRSALRSGKPQRADANRILPAFGAGTAVVTPVATPARRLVLCVAATSRARDFGQGEIALLRSLAGLCATAVEDLTVKDRLDSKIRACADELAAVYDSDNSVLAGSPIDAARLAMQVGTRLGLEPAALIELEIAARVSERGSAWIPGPGTAAMGIGAEWVEPSLRAGPMETAARLERVPGFQVVALIVRCIGERWDGRGPQRLLGHRIPLASRILAACDAIRVLTANRPYGAGATVATALRQVQAASGTMFDPTVVAALSHELLGDMPELGDTATTDDWARGDAQLYSVLR